MRYPFFNYKLLDKTEISSSSYLSKSRKDYCYDCENEELYTHAMTFKCSKCHKIILGGDKCQEEDQKK